MAIWTPELTVQFLDAIRDHPLYAVFHVMALRGLRRGDACGLRWCDVDLTGKTLTIAQQLQEDYGTLRYGPPKSRASQRTVALDTGTGTVLARHRTEQVTA